MNPVFDARVQCLPVGAALEEVWRGLDAQSGSSPFVAWDWQQLWHRHVAEQARVQWLPTLVTGPRGQPWMLLPLALSKSPLGRVLTWSGGPLADYPGVLVADACPRDLFDDQFPQLWRKITAVLPGFDLARLDRQRSVATGRPNPILSLPTQPARSRSHHTTLGPSWPELYRRRCSAKTRSTHRRKLKHLAADGPVQLVRATDAQQVDAILPTLTAWKSAQYSQLGVPDHMATPGVVGFLRAMTLAAPDRVHLTALMVGDRVVAAHWGLVDHECFYYLLPGYDHELSRLSPGDELARRLLAWACDQGLSAFDFTLGDEAYKDRWCDVTAPIYTATLSGSALGVALSSAEQARQGLVRRVKQSPRLYDLALKGRAQLLGDGD